MAYNIIKGEDLTITIPLVDDNNNKLSLTGSTSIRVGLIIKETIVYKYMDVSKETLISGYGTCNSGSTIYDLNVYLTRAQTADFPVGPMTANVLIRYAAGFQTNTYYEYSYDIGTVYKGYMNEETFV